MQITPKALFITAALMALSATAIAAQLSPEEQLAAAEMTWAMNKPDAYEFTYKQICYCDTPPAGTPESEPIIFHVGENGVGALITRLADRPQARQELEDKYSTVEKQFAYIRAELAKHPYQASIEYDKDFGNPRRVRFNLNGIADAAKKMQRRALSVNRSNIVG